VATLLDDMQKLYLDFYFINPLINPSNANYLDYYLEDKNYVSFTTTLGAETNAFISEY
jgi:hypothetical protein